MTMRLTPSSADDASPTARKAGVGAAAGGDSRRPAAPEPPPPERVSIVNSQSTTATAPVFALPPSDSGIGLSPGQPFAPFPTDLQKTVVVEEHNPLAPPPPGAAPPAPKPAPPQAQAPAAAPAPPAAPTTMTATTAAPAPAATPAEAPAPTAGAAAPAPRAPKLRRKRRKRSRLRHILPAWSVSLFVHLVVFSALAAATFNAVESEKKPLRFDTSLAGAREPEKDVPLIYADAKNFPRDQAILDEQAEGAAPTQVLDDDAAAPDDGGGGAIVAGAFAPSATPRVRGRGPKGVKEAGFAKLDGSMKSSFVDLPTLPAYDMINSGQPFSGDPAWKTTEVGAALDQIASEILRHLLDHKVTVVWLFDESESMQDDQAELAKKFNRVAVELNKNIDPSKKAAGSLNHSIIGFGQDVHFVTKRPTTEVDDVKAAVRKLPVDYTGAENTMHAIRQAVEAHAGLISKDRRVLLVLVTDESGDDGVDVEEARQMLRKHNVPLYVIGRQAMFGYPFAHHQYKDTVTGDYYHPLIRRGPEAADVELYQWDGLHDRWDEQPSGFAPWELARLARDSGGIYFILPSEEFMRVRHREQAYTDAQLREYLPEYDNRIAYVQKRTQSDLRRNLYQIIADTRDFTYRRDFPITPAEQASAAAAEIPRATERLEYLINVQEQRLEPLRKHREREPEKRWRAHYDLMLAQTVVFQIKAFEYRALMMNLAQNPQKPTKQPTPDLAVSFRVDHSSKPLAPPAMTAKKYAEAKRLLDDVIANHPNTPWADLAKDTLAKGFSVFLNQWEHNPKYHERAQNVPKY